jgi:hypothetical protein
MTLHNRLASGITVFSGKEELENRTFRALVVPGRRRHPDPVIGADIVDSDSLAMEHFGAGLQLQVHGAVSRPTTREGYYATISLGFTSAGMIWGVVLMSFLGNYLVCPSTNGRRNLKA